MPGLTLAQIATLKAAVAAEPSLAAAVAIGDDAVIKAWCNAPSTFSVYRTTTPGDTVRNAVIWNRMTPSDAPDATTTWLNRAVACQGYQFNLQMLTQGLSSIATGMSTIRQGLQDALSTVPSGALGANQNAGWGAVKTAITRLATNAEKVFATGTGTVASPGDIGWEGTVTADETSNLR